MRPLPVNGGPKRASQSPALSYSSAPFCKYLILSLLDLKRHAENGENRFKQRGGTHECLKTASQIQTTADKLAIYRVERLD